MPTSDEINEAVAEDLEAGLIEVEGDQTRAVGIDPVKRIQANRMLQDDAATTAGNSGWGRVLRARSVPPGAQ